MSARISAILLRIALLGLVWSSPLRAAENLEARVKSAFILNFARFATLDTAKFATSDSPLDICVLTPDTLGESLSESLRGKIVKGRAVRVRRADKAELLRDCHVVFVSERTLEDTDAALAKLAGFGVLTVHEGQTTLGTGIVRLFLQESRQRFEINLSAAEREKVQMASALLDMAQRVRQ